MEEQHSVLRQQAIDQMDLVYADASKVLVLDRALQELQVTTQDVVTRRPGFTSFSPTTISRQIPELKSLPLVAAHIFRSTWMTRAWTLQEGCLARDCAVQLQDCIIEVGDMDSKTYQKTGLTKASWFLCEHWLDFSGNMFDYLRFSFRLCDCAHRPSVLFQIADGAYAVLLMLLSVLANIIAWPLFPLVVILYEIPRSIQRLLPIVKHPGVKRFEPLSAICSSLTEAIQGSLRQVAPASRDDSQEKQFIQTWRALLGRSTKEPDDIPVIIANLTGFSAIDSIKRGGTGERMRTLLLSLNSIPLDVLLIDCPSRYSVEAPHPDQWIPLVPRGGPLSSSSFLEFQTEGYVLQLSASHQLFPIGGDPVQQLFFELSVERSSTNFSSKAPILKVACLGPREHSLQPQSVEKQYLLLENFNLASKGEHRGALLHLVRQSGSQTFLHYDCTVRVTLHDQPTMSGTLTSYLMKPPTTSILYLERGKSCSLLRFGLN